MPVEPQPRPTVLARLERLAADRPDLPLVAPFMTYLLLLGVTYALPAGAQPLGIALRGVLSLAVVWAFRGHLPPWGKPHWPVAILGGGLVAWGWVAGQYAADAAGLPGRLPFYPGEKVVVDPRLELGAAHLFWATWLLRCIVACTAVPVVEELFWRAFMLRALVDWHNFERVPLGHFAWRACIGSALLSTLQHPDNWIVSIPCWLIFNGVFYWTRSILCLVLLHGVTNLILYLIVLRVGDWAFW